MARAARVVKRGAARLGAVLDLSPSPQWEWAPVERPGCHGVEARVLFHGANLGVVALRFAPGGYIDAHAAPYTIEVVCMEGSGFVRVGSEERALSESYGVRWPMGVLHRLWTTTDSMTVYTFEHVGRGGGLT